jgi:hypothetical protein
MANKETMTVAALSTIDNPFNPIEDYESWLSYDISHGYNTSNWLANVAKTSDLLPNEDNNLEVERAIDEIVNIDPEFYVKVTKEIEV